MSSNLETIQFAVAEAVATVTINRPQALNALNAQVLKELHHVFTHHIHTDDTLRAVVVTGAGEKSFVAGADIVSMKAMSTIEAVHFVELGHKAMRAIETTQVPVIAAVNGFALGGGLELALACDFIYASKNAKLGLPEVNLGIFPGFGGTQRLPRLIGNARAKELIYTAKMLSADEALAWGIVNKVTEPADLQAEVKKTVDQILTKGPVAIRLAKKVVNEGVDLALASGLKLEESSFPVIFGTEDKNEGVTAFIEKRAAKFTGK